MSLTLISRIFTGADYETASLLVTGFRRIVSREILTRVAGRMDGPMDMGSFIGLMEIGMRAGGRAGFSMDTPS